MEDPPSPSTEDDEASIPPTEHVPVPTGPNLNQYPTITVRRKVAKRTFPFDLKIGETIQLVIPPPPRKKPRLGEHLSTSTDDAITENMLHDTTVELPPTDAASTTAATDHAALDPVMDYGIDPTTARTGKWTADEDEMLRNAVPAHGGKKWKAIALLVPGRTRLQCVNRWNNKLNISIDPSTARTGKWTADEDKKLKDGVREHGVKNWKAIALLVPGRTDQQCVKRWHDTLKPTFDPSVARTGKWTADEDTKLREVVGAHGGKNWEAIASLVPGRTKLQCRNRWREASVRNIDPVTARAVKWTADEDKQLKNAVPAQGGKNWEDIAALVPGRTKQQCVNRWRDALDPSIDRATASKGKRWTANEDKTLKEAVPPQGDKNWKEIAALVPGRTKQQCHGRWRDAWDPSIGRVTGRAGKWTADENKKLKEAVGAHGAKNWKAIALLVLGRTQRQCRNRWCNALDPSRVVSAGRMDVRTKKQWYITWKILPRQALVEDRS
jgi:hypothetical protein